MESFIPPSDLEGAIRQAGRDVECWRRARGKKADGKWAECAVDKDSLALMMRNREATTRSLDSPNVGIRLAAASLLADCWTGNERFTAQLLRLAFHDSESLVRGAAIHALWLVKHHVTDATGFLHKFFDELFPLPPKEVRAELLRGLREGRRLRLGAMEARWRDLAGTHAAAMAESRTAAESYLSHRDPKLRRAALLALKYHWTPDEAFAGYCERLVFEDQNVDVLSLALSCLAGCYSHSDDQRVGRLAAQIVLDDSAPKRLRATAYCALFTIRGMPTKAFLTAHRSSSSRFPENIDWAFVDSFVHRGS